MGGMRLGNWACRLASGRSRLGQACAGHTLSGRNDVSEVFCNTVDIQFLCYRGEASLTLKYVAETPAIVASPGERFPESRKLRRLLAS